MRWTSGGSRRSSTASSSPRSRTPLPGGGIRRRDPADVPGQGRRPAARGRARPGRLRHPCSSASAASGSPRSRSPTRSSRKSSSSPACTGRSPRTHGQWMSARSTLAGHDKPDRPEPSPCTSPRHREHRRTVSARPYPMSHIRRRRAGECRCLPSCGPDRQVGACQASRPRVMRCVPKLGSGAAGKPSLFIEAR